MSSEVDEPVVQGNGFHSEQFLLLLENGIDNNSEARMQLAINFINYLNDEVPWKYTQKFIFSGDETQSTDGVNGKLDKYLMNQDIAGFLGKYVFDSTAAQVLKSTEILDQIFENPKNKALATTFLGRFWNSWM